MQLEQINTAAAAAVTPAYMTGICAGTTIMTLNGETPVENLKAGDRIITRDSGMAILKDISQTAAKVAPVRIKAGSLGHTRPDRDMLMAPGAAIHIRDWRAEALFGSTTAKVAAHKLVDGEYLATQAPRDMDLFELTFDRQHIIYADGIELIAG